MASTKEEKLQFKRKSSHYILEPRVEKIAQVTYRTGEGRRMKTDRYYITKLDDTFVWLDKTTWDREDNIQKPVGSPFQVYLEKIHVVVDLDRAGLILFPAKMYKLKKR